MFGRWHENCISPPSPLIFPYTVAPPYISMDSTVPALMASHNVEYARYWDGSVIRVPFPAHTVIAAKNHTMHIPAHRLVPFFLLLITTPFFVHVSPSAFHNRIFHSVDSRFGKDFPKGKVQRTEEPKGDESELFSTPWKMPDGRITRQPVRRRHPPAAKSGHTQS